MIIKKFQDYHIKQNEYCGQIIEMLKEYPGLDIAMAIDIQPTVGHYHNNFDEIYFILDGELTLKFYDPHTREISDQQFQANEMCVINKGIHHQIVKASKENRLCLLTIPKWSADDEHISDVLNLD